MFFKANKPPKKVDIKVKNDNNIEGKSIDGLSEYKFNYDSYITNEMILKKEIAMPLFWAISKALLSAFTLKPMISASALEITPFMSDSEMGPIPFPTILNSAVLLTVVLSLEFILAISFSMASIEPETSAFKIIGMIFLDSSPP